MSFATSLRSIAPLNKRRFVLKAFQTGVVLLCIASVSACGKRPSSVDPPDGAEDNGFPYTYPAPETPPK